MFGSFVPALLWGVAVTNLLRGVAINYQMHYVGTFLDLLNPCALVGGIFFVFLFAFHGANFLLIKIADEKLLNEMQKLSFRLGLNTIFAFVLFGLVTAHDTDILAKISTVIFLGLSIAALIASCAGAKAGNGCKAFLSSTLAVAFLTIGFFNALFPRLMVSSLSPNLSLDIYNAASTPHTLTLMTIAAAIFVPIVLIYQAWTYRIFKERVTPADVHYH